MTAMATDEDVEYNMAEIDLEILVVDSQKKSPSFINGGGAAIHLKENYSDFSAPIANIIAV